MTSKKNSARPGLRRRIAGALAVTGVTVSLLAAAPDTGVAATGTATVQQVCSAPAPGYAQCLAERLVASGSVHPHGVAQPEGYDPDDLQSAYNLTSASANGGNGQTVALVDAYDDPYAESDLGEYRDDEGLPPCTTANGCFKKVNQEGEQGSYPAADKGWAGEISLDVDMVSAICPNCHILLVETDDNSNEDLGDGVDTAVALGAKFVSNSYGGGTSTSDHIRDASYYDHPGVVITASTGDDGYGVEFPAASPHVVAVGGTSLERASTPRGWAEITWRGAGSGCAVFDVKPSWQTDSGCSSRTSADVSAVADPNTGVNVYDHQQDGWVVMGGTSAASPIIAAVYALSGPQPGYAAQNTYAEVAADHSSVNDIVAGTNDPLDGGNCGGARYLCNGVVGYDGPTGLGTPNGTAAFRP